MRENRTVPFRDTSIKVSRNYYGHQYICMADVCEIIKQRELLKDGAILNLCPSAMKMTFRRNGREYWAIRPSEDRKSTRLNSSHVCQSRMPSSA